MADTEKVVFRRGPRETLPDEKVPGTIYITTNTGEMFLDDTDTSRIQVGPSPADVRSLGVSGATIGDIPTVKAVDASGVPTEWEAVELPRGAYIVNLTMDAVGNITADKTFAEIKAAHDDGKVVNAKFADAIVPLCSITDSDALFSQTVANSGGVFTASLTCTSDNVWSVSEDGFAAQVQSNYEQTDSSAKDYIKNRPFYEATETTDISGTSATIRAAGGTHDFIPLQVGQEWKVTAVSSASYEETFTVAENEQGEPYIGTTNAQPFYIRQTEATINSSFVSAIRLTALTLTCLSGTYSQIVTKTIDPKFLPEIDTRSLGLTGATIGQTVKIKTVDETGVPTKWEAVDAVSGDSKPFVVTVTYGADGTLTADKTHAEIVAAYAVSVQINAKIINYPGVNAPCILPLFLNNSDLVFMFSGSGVVGNDAKAMTATDTNGSWSVELTDIAKLTDIPTSLKNPESLTFTGAVSGSYDGSSAMTVNIPSSVEITGGTTDLTAGVSELASGALYIVYE